MLILVGFGSGFGMSERLRMLLQPSCQQQTSTYIRHCTMQGVLLTSSRPYRLPREPYATTPAHKPNKRRCLATSCQATAVEFSKYQGLGNDFILVKLRAVDTSIGAWGPQSTYTFVPPRLTTDIRKTCCYHQKLQPNSVTGTLALGATG